MVYKKVTEIFEMLRNFFLYANILEWGLFLWHELVYFCLYDCF